jgi:hypothetical protein
MGGPLYPKLKRIVRSIAGTWIKCALLEMLTAMFFFSQKVIGRSIAEHG